MKCQLIFTLVLVANSTMFAAAISAGHKRAERVAFVHKQLALHAEKKSTDRLKICRHIHADTSLLDVQGEDGSTLRTILVPLYFHWASSAQLEKHQLARKRLQKNFVGRARAGSYSICHAKSCFVSDEQGLTIVAGLSSSATNSARSCMLYAAIAQIEEHVVRYVYDQDVTELQKDAQQWQLFEADRRHIMYRVLQQIKEQWCTKRTKLKPDDIALAFMRLWHQKELAYQDPVELVFNSCASLQLRAHKVILDNKLDCMSLPRLIQEQVNTAQKQMTSCDQKEDESSKDDISSKEADDMVEALGALLLAYLSQQEFLDDTPAS